MSIPISELGDIASKFNISTDEARYIAATVQTEQEFIQVWKNTDWWAHDNMINSFINSPEHEIMNNLTLNNGTTATFKYIDDWRRPTYELESGTLACCVNLDGTYLHTISRDGEPESPLLPEYQPAAENNAST